MASVSARCQVGPNSGWVSRNGWLLTAAVVPASSGWFSRTESTSRNPLARKACRNDDGLTSGSATAATSPLVSGASASAESRCTSSASMPSARSAPCR
ncbi:Uncharacterised protein [Mycobacteroides abscessus subsp. abscessus]|nr:Uncharacterised protein [Mycobacteroides abscessus subsp. abscessus]